MSLIPTPGRFAAASGAVISQFSMVTPEVWRSEMPKPSTPWTIRTLRTVTLLATTSMLALTEYPSKTAPAPSMLTQPRESQCQPAPEVTWPGTASRALPATTPVFDSSGYPQALGRDAHPLTVGGVVVVVVGLGVVVVVVGLGVVVVVGGLGVVVVVVGLGVVVVVVGLGVVVVVVGLGADVDGLNRTSTK